MPPSAGFAFSVSLHHEPARAASTPCRAPQPVVNQVELHPYLQQPELSAFHKTHGVLTSSYGPLTPLVHAKGGPLDPLLNQLAKKYDKTPEQVGIAVCGWCANSMAAVVAGGMWMPSSCGT